MVVHVICRNMV